MFLPFFIREEIMKIFSLITILFVMCFYPLSALAYYSGHYQGGVAQSCVSPQQLAGLFSKSKKPSLSASIKSLKRDIKGIEKQIKRELIPELEGYAEELEKFLNKTELDEEPSDVAKKIKDYMESRKDKWCETAGGSTYFYPRSVEEFVSFIFPEAEAGGKSELKPANCVYGESVWDKAAGKCRDIDTSTLREDCELRIIDKTHYWDHRAERCTPIKRTPAKEDCKKGTYFHPSWKKCMPKTVTPASPPVIHSPKNEKDRM